MALATAPPSAPPAIARARSGRRTAAALLAPGLLALGVTFLLPLIWLVRMSLNRGDASGAITPALSLDSYEAATGDAFYWKIAWSTVELGLIVTVCTLVISYPVALFLTRTQSRWRGVLVALAIAPLLTSAVVRTYGWMVILGDQGVLNGGLRSLGLVDTPLRLSNNFAGASIALVEILMPYAILAMLSGFGRISEDLEQAAASLGANRLWVFLRVTLPLSLPGVLTAGLLVFVLTISSFVTPSLVGGGRVFVLATEIYNQATFTLNWPLAAALSVLLLILFGAVIISYQRAVRALEH
jgi:putative spermidine/putrescine transport system permease protein